MNEKKEYLTEENYQKGVGLLKKISLIVLIGGLLIGVAFIVIGTIVGSKTKNSLENITNGIGEAIGEVSDNITDSVTSGRTQEEIQADIDAIQSQLDSLNTEISKLETEKTSIFMESGFSDEYYQKEKEIEIKKQEQISLTSKMAKCKIELGQLQNNGSTTDEVTDQVTDVFNAATGVIDESQKGFSGLFNNIFSGTVATIFYSIGLSIIGFAGIISLVLFLIAKRREITAFTTQQVMPVAQEGIDKMAPTMGSAAEQIAGGIKRGIDNSDNNNNMNNMNDINNINNINNNNMNDINNINNNNMSNNM